MARLLWFLILALFAVGAAAVIYLALTDLPPPHKPVVIEVPDAAFSPEEG